MKKSALVLALIAMPVSYALADSSESYAVIAMSDLKIKVAIFLGWLLVGACCGAVLTRRMSKKHRMLRDLTFSFSVLTGSLVGMLFSLGIMPS